MFKVIIITNPFNLRDRSETDVDLKENQKLIDYKLIYENFSEDVVLTINGIIPDENNLKSYFPRRNDYIVILPVIQGGGGDKKNPIALIATIALTGEELKS